MDKIGKVRLAPLGKSIYIKPFKMLYEQNGVEKSWDLMEIHDSVAIIIYNVTRDVMIFVKQFRPGVYYSRIKAEDKLKPIDPAVYPAELGMTIELCAGIKDKDKSLAEIAQEEVIEETGYKVPLDKFEKVHSYNKCLGISSCLVTIYYCEVTDSMKKKHFKNDFAQVIEVKSNDMHDIMKKTVLPYCGNLLLAYFCASVGISGSVVAMFYCEVTDDMRVSKGGGVDQEMIEVIEMTIDETMNFLKKDIIPSPGSFITGIYWFLMFKHKKLIAK